MVNYHNKYKHSTVEVELGNALHFQMDGLKSRQHFETLEAGIRKQYQGQVVRSLLLNSELHYVVYGKPPVSRKFTPKFCIYYRALMKINLPRVLKFKSVNPK